MNARLLVRNDHARLSPALLSAEESAARAAPATDVAAAFRRGEEWATAKLIAENTSRVAALTRRLLAWPDDVDDVVNDTFVSALVNREKFRGDATFSTWISRIAINRCRAHNRKKWLRSRLLDSWRAGQERQQSTAVDDSAAYEEIELVRSAVATLPQTYREVIVLYYLEQLSASEVADILNLKTNTVEKRLSRARTRLAEVLGENAELKASR